MTMKRVQVLFVPLPDTNSVRTSRLDQDGVRQTNIIDFIGSFFTPWFFTNSPMCRLLRGLLIERFKHIGYHAWHSPTPGPFHPCWTMPMLDKIGAKEVNLLGHNAQKRMLKG